MPWTSYERELHSETPWLSEGKGAQKGGEVKGEASHSTKGQGLTGVRCPNVDIDINACVAVGTSPSTWAYELTPHTQILGTAGRGGAQTRLGGSGRLGSQV